MLRVQGLKVEFRDHVGARVPVLDIEEFKVEEGAQVCLVGGSGSGKTTLLNVLAGITPPTKGKVFYGKKELSALSEPERDRFRAAHVGYVFQSFNLLQGLTALENVAIAGTFAGQSTGDSRERAIGLLERLGLGHRLMALPGTMSVGEQQRVGIARALVNRPKVVLADEPTAALDDQRAEEVLDLLVEIVREEDSTLVLVTHDARVKARFDDVIDLHSLGADADDDADEGDDS